MAIFWISQEISISLLIWNKLELISEGQHEFRVYRAGIDLTVQLLASVQGFG
jgi:hypothetical protein